MNSWLKIYRTLLLVLVLSVTVVIFPRLIFDDSLQSWVPEDSEIINDYKTFLEAFKSDAFILVSIVDSSREGQDTFSIIIDDLISQASQLEHVQTARRWPPLFLKHKQSPPEHIHSFYITFLPPSHVNPNRPDLVQNLRDLLDRAEVNYHLAGTGVIHEAINETTSRSSKLYLGIGFALLLILLVLFVKDPEVIMKTIGIALGSVAFMLLAAYLLNVKFNTIMSILPCLILFYSTSVSVHILNHKGDIRKVFWPTLTAVLTTCAGFSAFLLDAAPLLQDFGLLAIAGLIGSLFWALVLYYPPKDMVRTEIRFKKRLHIIEKWWHIRSLWLGIILLILLIPGVLRIRSEIDIFSALPKNHKTVRDYHFIENHVGYFMPVEYRVDIDRTDRKELIDWMEAVYQIDEVGAVMSYLSIPAWMNREELGFVSEDGTAGRIVFSVPVMTTTEGVALVNQIDDLAKQYFTENHVIPKPTGFASLYVSVADNLTKSFRESLLLAFIFVFLIIFIFVRNLRLFLASVLPNLLPVMAILGVMGWFRIPLDMVTVPMGCMALGIIVDDTVHFLYWYRKSGDVHVALDNAGPGTVITSLIYILGFSIFLFSAAVPVRYFGILSITTMIAALYGDMVILPTILKRFAR